MAFAISFFINGTFGVKDETGQNLEPFFKLKENNSLQESLKQKNLFFLLE